MLTPHDKEELLDAIMREIEKLCEEPPLKLCKYAHDCKHFQDSAFTCWHNEEAEKYCGVYGTSLMWRQQQGRRR